MLYVTYKSPAGIIYGITVHLICKLINKLANTVNNPTKNVYNHLKQTIVKYDETEKEKCSDKHTLSAPE